MGFDTHTHHTWRTGLTVGASPTRLALARGRVRQRLTVLVGIARTHRY